MGCASSAYPKKKRMIEECAVFVPPLRSSHLLHPSQLNVVAPNIVIDTFTSLRSQIQSGAHHTVTAGALDEYLSLLTGFLFKKTQEKSLQESGPPDTCFTNVWMEILSVMHMKAVLALSEANALMLPKDTSGSGTRVVSSECKRNAVDLLIKASGYLEFCVREILLHIPPEMMKEKKMGEEMQESVIRALSIQALGLGTEIQLGLAVESQKATLSVKRRLACEQVLYFTHAYQCLSSSQVSHGRPNKLLRFIFWKFLEAKAAAYYYHGLVTDKGNEPASHVSAVCCFIAAAEILAESKKACLSFCLAPPVTRAPPLWGVMKHLHQKIPDVACRKSQMYGYLLEEEKALQSLPELPDFQLSLRPDDFQLPEIHTAWNLHHLPPQS